MAWVKLDDAMPTHPKLMAAGPTAFALDVAGLCYSNKHGTDGFIATYVLPAVFPGLSNPKRVAAKLVEVERWAEVDGGWMIHDVHEYQPTAEHQKELSKKRAEAGRKGGSKSPTPTQANGKQNACGGSNPVPARTPEGQEPLSTAVDPDDGFDHFWQAWPRRNGKKLAKDKAHRAWSRLTLPDRRDAYRGAKNYAAASDAEMAGAKDAFRWLQGREWDDWQEPARLSGEKAKARSVGTGGVA